MKKIIFLWGILLPITFSFALTINPTPTNIENAAKNGILHLDNGKNTFNKGTGYTNQIQLDHKKNNFKCSSCTFDNITNPLHITCKNGLISKIQGYANHTPNYILTGNFQSLILDYNYSDHEYKSNIILQCKPITQPIKQIIENTDINFQNINTKTTIINKTPQVLENALTSIKKEITQEGITYLTNGTGSAPFNQPSFIDILFLQLGTISNLSDSILTLNPNINFSGLFLTESDFNNYQNWLDKFTSFSTKKDFVNAFSGAITLKDIGIAQDIILGEYQCLQQLKNNPNYMCNGIIKFNSKDTITNTNSTNFPSSKFDIYTLNEIEKLLYSGNNNIISGSIDFANTLLNKCIGDSIGDDFVKTQVNGICNLLKKQANELDQTDLDLGYGLTIRIQNLKTLKNSFERNGTNLLGIYNVYWELNNLAVGSAKASVVKKITETPDIEKQLEELQKIDEIDNKLIKQNKIPNIEEQANIKSIIQTREQIINGVSPLSVNDVTDTNLFNKNNYTVEDGVVTAIITPSGRKSITNDSTQVNSSSTILNGENIDSVKIKISIPPYLEIKTNLTTYNFKPIFILGYRNIYVNENKKEEIKNKLKDCQIEKKVCSFMICIRYTTYDYDCINTTLKPYNYFTLGGYKFDLYAYLHQANK